MDAEREFVKIGELKSGQRLTSADGSQPIVTNVRRYSAHVEAVHDITIAGVHTYHVLAGSITILVHNCGTGAARFAADSNGEVTDLDQNPLDASMFAVVSKTGRPSKRKLLILWVARTTWLTRRTHRVLAEGDRNEDTFVWC
jgi:hypothetical protein